ARAWKATRVARPRRLAHGVRARLMDKRRRLRKFGLTVGGVFLVLALTLFLRHRRGAFMYAFSGIGGGLVLGGALVPALLAPVERAWMAVAHVLGWINTRILLTAVFFVVFTPISLVLRLIGRDPLDRKRDKSRPSYWID